MQFPLSALRASESLHAVFPCLAFLPHASHTATHHGLSQAHPETPREDPFTTLRLNREPSAVREEFAQGDLVRTAVLQRVCRQLALCGDASRMRLWYKMAAASLDGGEHKGWCCVTGLG